MSTKARLYKFLIDMKRITINEVEEPFKAEIIENSYYAYGLLYGLRKTQ